MVTGEATVADHGVGGHADEPCGGPHTVTVSQMLKDREGLLRGQLRAEQRRALAFGEPIPAGAAVQEPDVLVLAVPGTDGQVAKATPAVVGTVVVLAAEAGKIVVHGSVS